MMFGREPKLPADLMSRTPEINLPITNEEFILNLKENFRRAFEVAAKNSEIKVDLSKIRYDRTSYACIFKPGDKVWVRDYKHDPSLCKKFCNAWRGPYTVIQRIDDVIYKLKPDKAKGRVILMHRNNLKVCIPRKIEGVQEERVNEREKEKKPNRPEKTEKRPANPRKDRERDENMDTTNTEEDRRVLRPRKVTTPVPAKPALIKRTRGRPAKNKKTAPIAAKKRGRPPGPGKRKASQVTNKKPRRIVKRLQRQTRPRPP
jgi:hypothetical protein